MIEEAEKGLVCFRPAEQFSHVFAVAKNFRFCTTWIAVQAPVKFKVFERTLQLFKATERAAESEDFLFKASWEQLGNVPT